MKKFLGLAIVTMVVMVASCKKDNGTTNDVIVGSYRVSSFVDNGTDKTVEFSGYSMTFNNNGDMNVDSGGMMSMCGWSNNNGVYHFNMGGMHNNSLNEMDGDWTMTSYNDTICNFSDDGQSRNCKMVLHRK